jgi:predicted  nucleic acid-binding Zn-ribbon protein
MRLPGPNCKEFGPFSLVPRSTHRSRDNGPAAMKQTLAKILELQDSARRTAQLRRDIERLSIDVENQARLVEDLERRAEQAHERRFEATKKADALQLDIEQAEEQIEHFRLQLNVTKHQKEYDALQHAILSKRADIGKCEDEELEALQAVDSLTEQEKQLAGQIEQAKDELRRITKEAARMTAEQSRRLEALEAEQVRMREQINPDVLAAYDRLAARDRKRPLAEVRGRICLGCHTRVTKQSENLLMRGTEIVYCHSCGRMLVLSDD